MTSLSKKAFLDPTDMSSFPPKGSQQLGLFGVSKNNTLREINTNTSSFSSQFDISAVRSKRFRPYNVSKSSRSSSRSKFRSKSNNSSMQPASRQNITSLSSEYLPILKQSISSTVDQRISMRKQRLFSSSGSTNLSLALPSLITSFSVLCSSPQPSKAKICGLYNTKQRDDSTIRILTFSQSSSESPSPPISLISPFTMPLPNPLCKFLTINPPWTFFPSLKTSDNLASPHHKLPILIFHSFQLSERPILQSTLPRHLSHDITRSLFFHDSKSLNINNTDPQANSNFNFQENSNPTLNSDVSPFGNPFGNPETKIFPIGVSPLPELENPTPTVITSFNPLLSVYSSESTRNLYSWNILGFSNTLSETNQFIPISKIATDILQSLPGSQTLTSLLNYSWFWFLDSSGSSIVILSNSRFSTRLSKNLVDTLQKQSNSSTICLIFPVEDILSPFKTHSIIPNDSYFSSIKRVLQINEETTPINIYLIE